MHEKRKHTKAPLRLYHDFYPFPRSCHPNNAVYCEGEEDLERAGSGMVQLIKTNKLSNFSQTFLQAHFTKNEVQFIINKRPELAGRKSWRNLYLALRKHFGLRQQFTELLMLCKNCRLEFTWLQYALSL